MKSPKAIIYLYEGYATLDSIKRPANYSLSRLMLENEKLNCPVFFLNKSKGTEAFKNLKLIYFSYWNLIKLLMSIGFSNKVILVSTSDKFDKLSVWIKFFLGYKLIIRRGGVYYGKSYIRSEHFKAKVRKHNHFKNIDMFLSTADGTPVLEYTDAYGIPREKVKSWLNGIPQIENKHGYVRENQIICIARLSHEKCVDYVIESFATALPLLQQPHKLIIVGDGEERTSLQQLVNKLGITEFVDFVGYSDDVEYWFYTSKLLITGKANNTILESIATNTHAICLELGEFQTQYANFKNLTFIPYETGGYGKISKEEMAPLIQLTSEKIVEILNDYTEVTPSDNLDLSNYSWDSRLDKERALYLNLIANETKVLS